MTKIVAHSRNGRGDEAISFLLQFPRYLLAELNTHAMFARNSASSRAIPFKKMVKTVQETPFIPMFWQREHTGMQGTVYVQDKEEIKYLERMWLVARDWAVSMAVNLHNEDISKQITNRPLEPYMYHTALVTTSTQGLTNFFQQRCPRYTSPSGVVFYSKKQYMEAIPYCENGDYTNPFFWTDINKGMAEPHFMFLAECMYDAYIESVPDMLQAGDYHIPFHKELNGEEIYRMMKKLHPDKDFTDVELEQFYNSVCRKVGIANAARTSYIGFGDELKHDYARDCALYEKLFNDKHLSPFEHVAKCMNDDEYYSFFKGVLGNDLDMGAEPYGWAFKLKGFIPERWYLEHPTHNFTTNRDNE